ncbi:PEGA domain-containing protein [Methanoregula sp. UBA64]|uniref:PEGA domain-containing protein n=1 Tax=Methanoregula sp. UBA64 TaxID=1915554 RepID=UPI0025E65DD4|nr:PEGA domain-containing protein [Methanoregula sp. UBA64]
MKHSIFLIFLAGMILLLTLAVPVAADPAISGISPTSAYRGNSVTMTITGTGFDLPTSSSYKYVRLMMDGEDNITAASISSKSTTKIVAVFSSSRISSSITKGTWTVVVVNDDGSESTYDGFTISDDMTLSSISPTYAKTNTDDASFTLTGTSLSDVTEVYLYKSGYDNITTSDISAGSTTVTGTFDLTDASEETYKVCVMDSVGAVKCSSSVTFEVTTDEVGEIDISSSPSGATVYIDTASVGTTPYAATGLTVGSHIVKITKDGYVDWSKIVKVTSGDTTTVDAELTAMATAVITNPPTPMPTTIKTVIPVTTIKVPTTYPKITTAAATTTKVSPVEGAVVLGAIGLGIVVLRRKK